MSNTAVCKHGVEMHVKCKQCETNHGILRPFTSPTALKHGPHDTIVKLKEVIERREKTIAELQKDLKDDARVKALEDNVVSVQKHLDKCERFITWCHEGNDDEAAEWQRFDRETAPLTDREKASKLAYDILMRYIYARGELFDPGVKVEFENIKDDVFAECREGKNA